tara:strand:- start:1252 stop:1440 length:189 start_codon:yes stop_codon:yes gene_type:complete
MWDSNLSPTASGKGKVRAAAFVSPFSVFIVMIQSSTTKCFFFKLHGIADATVRINVFKLRIY